MRNPVATAGFAGRLRRPGQISTAMPVGDLGVRWSAVPAVYC
jgi:hypothetical protein